MSVFGIGEQGPEVRPVSYRQPSYRPATLATRRHCLDCAVSWCSTKSACWCCGAAGGSGLYPHEVSRPFETYDGPVHSSEGEARR